MESYQNALDGFKARYGIKLDIKNQYEAFRKLRGLDDFTLSSSPQKKAFDIYLETLTTTLVDYLEPKVKMESGKTYDLSDVDVVKFVEDFDKVINAMHTEEDPQSAYKPYAGVKLSTMSSQAWKRINYFNIPLPSVWAGQIRKGTISHEQLQSVTSGAIEAIGNKTNDQLDEQDKKHLADIIMAKNAMETAINKRSFWSYLNPANWGPYSRETKYKESLENKIKEYEQRGLNMTNILPEVCSTNMLSNAHKGLQDLIENKRKAPEVNEELNKQQIKQANPIAEEKPKKVYEYRTNKEAAINMLKDKNAVEDQIAEVFGNSLDERFKVSINMTIYELANKAIPQCWDKFNAAEDETQKEAILKEYETRVFKSVFNGALGPWGMVKPLPEKLAMAQKLTNLIMGKYSPATANESYEKYGENYYIQNTDLQTIKKETFAAVSNDDLQKAVDQAKFDLGIGKIQINANDAVVNNETEKVSKIIEPNEPTKVINKDAI